MVRKWSVGDQSVIGRRPLKDREDWLAIGWRLAGDWLVTVWEQVGDLFATGRRSILNVVKCYLHT